MPHPELKATLKKRLEGASKIAILGVGSEIRGDDAAGILAARQLKNEPQLEVIIGGTTPENLTGEIKKLNPSHLIIIDAADMGEKAGTIKLIDPAEAGGYSFSTHSLPLKLMIDYLLAHFHCEIMIIGIQPATIAFGSVPSPEILKSIQAVAAAISNVI